MKKAMKRPAIGLLGATVLGSAFAAGALAGSSPFAMTDLAAGYQLAQADTPAEGKCGEGKCGEMNGGEKAGSEGKCGCNEGKCGEGKCGGDKAAHEKAGTEGKAATEGNRGAGKQQASP